MLFQTVAHSQQGIQVDASTAVRGAEFYCPSCKGSMILRRGEKNIAHFSHKNLTPNCKPETVLHLVGKEEVKRVIERHIENGEELSINFACSHCGSRHTKNLVENISSVQLEKSLDFARPDVSLLDKEEITRVVVEVVVTHEPEADVLKLFEQKKVFYVRIKLKDYLDLKNIEEFIQDLGWRVKEKYSTETFCVIKDNSELFCSKHGWAKDQRRLFVMDYPCNRCHQNTKIAVLNLDSDNPFNRELPDQFTDEEIRIARREGVLLDKHKFSQHQNGYYWLVNKCNHCKSLPYYNGTRKIDTQYEYGDWYEKHPQNARMFETGYTCEECEWEKT